MYVPKPFAVEDRKALLALIEREPFGVLVSHANGEPVATHAPFVLLREEPLTLGVHVARANPQWKSLAGERVLAIFQGPHAFVSASWYAQPLHTVPTWNYVAVHCTGRAALTDDEGTREILRRLVAAHDRAWPLDQVDPDYIAAMERAIAGIEIAVDRVDGAFKLSQNRTPEDAARVVRALESSDRQMDRDVAAAMREVR